MKNIIRKILKEDRRQEYLNKIVKVMKNDFPLFGNLKLYGFYDQLSKEEINYVFSGIFGKPVIYRYGGIFNENRRRIYDENGRVIYYEDSEGYWLKREFDENGNILYYENSDGTWVKREYDNRGKIIYSENSNGEIIDKR